MAIAPETMEGTPLAKRVADAEDLQFGIAMIMEHVAPGSGLVVQGAFATVRGMVARRERVAQREFLVAFAEQIDRLNEEKLDKTTVESEDFAALLIGVMEASRRQKAKENIDRLAAIVAIAACTPLDKWGPFETLSYALAELTEDESIALGMTLKLGPNKIDAQRLAGELPARLRGTSDFLLRRLVRTGLIAETVATMAGYGGGDFHLTDGGRALRDYLTNAPVQQTASKWMRPRRPPSD